MCVEKDELITHLIADCKKLSKESQHTLVVSSNGMLVKRDLTSRLAMKSTGSWLAISLANSKLFLTVYILVVIGSRRGTSNLGSLYVCVLVADITGLKGGQLSTNCLWTLQRP